MKQKNRVLMLSLLMMSIFVTLVNSCKKDEDDDSKTQSTVKDIDGNVYHTVKIGTQVWMVENLRTTKYNDGSAIQNVTDNTAWSALTTPAYCWYNNDPIANKSTYGALYNWYAVNTNKLCPVGWHVPTDAEWKTLEVYLGMSSEQADAISWRGTDQGNKMKSTQGWYNDGNGTNTSGFSAFPGGYRNNTDGTFDHESYFGYLWCANEFDTMNAWNRSILYNCDCVYRAYNFKADGFSVRCVKNN